MRHSFGKSNGKIVRFARAGALAGAALAASLAAADYCGGLTKKADLNPQAKAVLNDPDVEKRIVDFDADPEFQEFLVEVRRWMDAKHTLGNGSEGIAKLRRPRRHDVEATMTFTEPRDVRIQFEISDARGFLERLRGGRDVAGSIAVLDAQAMQLALAGKLFAEYDESKLRSLLIEWKLPKDAPEALAPELARMGFATARVEKRCLLKKFGYAGVWFFGGGLAGYYAGTRVEYGLRWGENPFEAGVIGAGVGGVVGGVTAFMMTCRKPSYQNDSYKMLLTRVAPPVVKAARKAAAPAAKAGATAAKPAAKSAAKKPAAAAGGAAKKPVKKPPAPKPAAPQPAAKKPAKGGATGSS